MKLIVGLGNPGTKYEKTRHNIGFDAITCLADDHRISVTEKKHKALCGKGIIGGEKVILLKPQTYMNLSGEAVAILKQKYKDANLIVVCDDIDLPKGTVRFRESGSGMC